MDTKKYKIVLLSDILSSIFGIVGVILGIMSIIALTPSWNISEIKRENDSFYFTIITIIFDFLSALGASIAFIIGKSIYKKTKKSGHSDPKKLKTEKCSLFFDLNSFAFGIIGLIFGFTSLMALIEPLKNEQLSIVCTYISITLDTISFTFAILATIFFVKISEKTHKVANKKTNNIRIKANSIKYS